MRDEIGSSDLTVEGNNELIWLRLRDEVVSILDVSLSASSRGMGA